MFSDLFSSLDGCFSWLIWVPSMIFIFIFVNKSFMNSYNNIVMLFFTKFGYGNKKLLPFGLFMMTIMYFLFNMNFLGLTPFTFTMSSSIWFSTSLALILWMLAVISSFTFSFKKTIAHLVPSGAPNVLIPFLVVIESISLLIRPLTLSVRLIANISAGHIVLSLIANVLSSALVFNKTIVFLMLSVGYNMFEVFVCFIQAYIFSLLLKLYSLEHP
uniref:ATP synthase subunit a n=1 Tax=Gyraulus sp. GE1 TaxID=2880038 RepID=A0A976QLT4_9GAST|nr:ATP synthase F0 subunit 6 [Gyraulus sp. GE1]